MQSLAMYIEQGGVIMYILIALNIIGMTTMIFKLIQYIIVCRKKDTLQMHIIESVSKNNIPQDNIALIMDNIKDEITTHMLRLEGGLSTVKTIASVAPLLGLLGTVLGVLLAFESISKAGMDDPTVFAGGISLALVTTVAGLIVAIPHYIGYNYLIRMLDKLESGLHHELNTKIYKGLS